MQPQGMTSKWPPRRRNHGAGVSARTARLLKLFEEEALVRYAPRTAAGYLRHQVRNQMRLRVAPDLVFRIDASVERGARLSALIHDAVESDKRRHVEPDPDPE